MEEFRRYEGMIIIDPAVQTKGYNDSIKRVEEFIKEKGGTLIYTEKIGMTTLAYEIKKNKKVANPKNIEIDIAIIAMFSFIGITSLAPILCPLQTFNR